MISTTIKPTIANPSNKKYLSELYFTAITERESLKRSIQRTSDPQERDLLEITGLDKLIDDLRNILGTTIKAVP